MAISDTLHEAEADLAALAGLPGEIRARVKAGLAELQRLRDAIDAAIADMTGAASATLKSLQAMASAEAPAAEPRADSVSGSFGG